MIDRISIRETGQTYTTAAHTIMMAVRFDCDVDIAGAEVGATAAGVPARDQLRHGVGTGTVVLLYHATAPSITGVQLNYTVDIGSPDMATTRAINGQVFDFMAHSYIGPSISVHTSHAHGAWTVLIEAYHRSFQGHAAQCISARGGYVGRTVLELHAGYVDQTGKSSVPCGPSTAFRDRVYRALVAQAHGQ